MTDREPVSAWTIATGILLAAVIIYGIPRLVAAYQYRQAVSQLQEQSRRADAQARERQRLTVAARARHEQAEAAEVALKPGERCIGEIRFRRVDNGWEQIGSC